MNLLKILRMSASQHYFQFFFQKIRESGNIIIYLVMALVIILLFWRFSEQNYQRISNQNAIYAEDMARQMVDRLDDQFVGALQVIKTYAYFIGQMGETPFLSQNFLKEMEENSPFDGLRYVDVNGLSHAGAGGMRHVGDRGFFKKGMTGASGISVVPFSHIYQQPVLTFYTPLRINGKLRGILNGYYLANRYLRNLLETSYFGVSAELFLCRPDGWIIANSAGKKYSENIFSLLRQEGILNEKTALQAEKLFQREDATLECASSSWASFVTFTRVPNPNLVLVQAFPASVTRAITVRANRSGVELEICLLLLFGLHAAFLLWRSSAQKRKLIREGKEKSQVVAAVNSLFANRYALCDLENGEYRYIAGSSPSDPELPKSGPYAQMLAYQRNLLIDDEDRENFEDYFSIDSMRTQLAASDFEVYECHVERNGKEEWENLNAICIERDSAGAPLKMIFMRQNMTEKKARELKLEKRISVMDRQERQYQLAVTSSAIFSFEFNVTQDLIERDIQAREKGGRYSLLKALTLKAPCRASAFYEALMQTVQPDSREDFSVLLNMEHLRKRYGEGQKELDLEFWQTHPDGTEKCMRLSFYMTLDDRTEDIMALAVARDITAQVMRQRLQTKTLQEALLQARHANESKTTFLSNMSHDIRTPMNAIIGFSTIALSHLDNRDQVRDCLTKVLSSSNHLLSLINDILDMSRIESGKMQIKEQECNISELMHNLVNIIQPQVKAKQLQLFIDTFEVANENVLADPLKLNQIFINLLGNAVKYTPAGGFVSFRIRQSPAFRHGYADYIFEVRDSGIGMSEEFVKHIFEPFTRESTTTQSGIQGTGLGMAIARNIIDMMNGKIEVESALGKGSVFTVTLTLKLLDKESHEKAIEQLKGIRALVVDDDFHVCDSVDKMLRKIGLRSEWTSSGREAVQRAQIAHNDGDPFNTFILDWHMPGQNGVETARQIRRIVGSDTPIIILTAYDWAEIEEEAKEAGISAFCAKPLFMSDLRNALLTSHKLLEVEEAPESETLNFGQKRILLVDDLEMNREVAEFILTESGFLVEMAPDGTDAVEMVAKSPENYYDAILMDVQMPIMNGYEATRAIRNMNREDIKTMPIIAMTANALEEDRAAALKCGMNAHVSKPVDIKKFFEVMKGFFGDGRSPSGKVDASSERVA